MAGDDADDGLPDGIGELDALCRALEAELRLERERRDPLALGLCLGGGPLHVAPDLLGEREQVVGRGRVPDVPPVRPDRPEDPRRKHERAGRGDVALLDHVALALAAGRPQEAGPLERADVVVDPLPRQPEPARELRGADGLTRQRQKPQSERVKQSAGAPRIRNGLEVHAGPAGWHLHRQYYLSRH